jgi:hypothetical protein
MKQGKRLTWHQLSPLTATAEKFQSSAQKRVKKPSSVLWIVILGRNDAIER